MSQMRAVAAQTQMFKVHVHTWSYFRKFWKKNAKKDAKEMRGKHHEILSNYTSVLWNEIYYIGAYNIYFFFFLITVISLNNSSCKMSCWSMAISEVNKDRTIV